MLDAQVALPSSPWAGTPSDPWAGGVPWPGTPGTPGMAGVAGAPGAAGAQAGAAATAATKMATAEKILEYCILMFEVGRFKLKDCLGGSDY